MEAGNSGWITVEHLRKVYGSGPQQVVALEDASLRVDRGEVFGVLGPSGAGKSTLIRCLNLLERPTSGRIVLAGTDLLDLDAAELRRQRRRIGMIFQHFHLLHSRTAAENVALPLEIAAQLPRAARQRRVAELLELVGLSARARAYPSQLSGGQRQRVGIARALAAEPDVLLADEPTSALDAEATASVLALLRELNQRLGLTIVLITHELDVVKAVCTSAALLENGRIVESGALPELVGSPQSRLGRSLLPNGFPPAPDRGQIFDIVFADAEKSSPALTALAGALNVEVRLLAGAIEWVAGRRVGRLQIAVSGTPTPDATAVTAFLAAGGARVSPV